MHETKLILASNPSDDVTIDVDIRVSCSLVVISSLTIKFIVVNWWYQGRQRRGGWGDASPPSFWPGGSNASHPPLAAVAIGFNDLHLW